jgi:hypothetical protein
LVVGPAIFWSLASLGTDSPHDLLYKGTLKQSVAYGRWSPGQDFPQKPAGGFAGRGRAGLFRIADHFDRFGVSSQGLHRGTVGGRPVNPVDRAGPRGGRPPQFQTMPGARERWRIAVYNTNIPSDRGVFTVYGGVYSFVFSVFSVFQIVFTVFSIVFSVFKVVFRGAPAVFNRPLTSFSSQFSCFLRSDSGAFRERRDQKAPGPRTEN